MSDELREHVFGKQDDQGLEIMPENWQAVELFCFCNTQWSFTDSGTRLGLNYPSVMAVLQAHRIPAHQHGRLLAQIRLIELGTLAELRERAEQNNGA